jgi:hypothetical protein
MLLLRSTLNSARSLTHASDTVRPAVLPLRSSCSRFDRHAANRPSPALWPLQNAAASALQAPVGGACGVRGAFEAAAGPGGAARAIPGARPT